MCACFTFPLSLANGRLWREAGEEAERGQRIRCLLLLPAWPQRWHLPLLQLQALPALGASLPRRRVSAPHHRWSGSPSPSSVFPSSACPFLHLTSCGSVSCWDASWDRAGPFSRLPALLPVSTGMRPTAASPPSETRQAKSASPWPSALFLSPCCCGNNETGVSKG